MPIAVWMKQHITNTTDSVLIRAAAGDDSPTAVMPAVITMYRDAVFFDVQVAHDVLMEQWKNHRRTNDWTAVLPFACNWLEWSDEVTGRNVACVVSRGNRRYHADPPEGSVFAMFWTMVPGCNPKVFPIEVELVNDANGVVQEEIHSKLGGLPGVDLGDDDFNNCSKYASYYMLTAFTALGLINCRNVDTQEAPRIRLRRNGTQKRRGQPAPTIRYNTIILPGGGSQWQGTKGSGTHRATALHRVRGHFKTFTADRPLMGQHVGTYWWGWQVRGNADNGVVVSDYRLGEAGDETRSA